MNHVIDISKVSKVYLRGSQPVIALDQVDLGVRAGDFLAIMGHSGSGKSTLMHILGCMDRPTRGSYTLDGMKVSGLDDDFLSSIRNHKIGFVFQDFNLLPRMTALENVCLPLAYSRASSPAGPRSRKAETTDLGRKALGRVGLAKRMDHLPSQMSGGEQQRVAIARSLVNRPQVILADEPTGNLDTKSSDEIMAIFQDLNDEGHTLVMVTHEPDVARYCRKVVVLKDGKVIKENLVKNRKKASRLF